MHEKSIDEYIEEMKRMMKRSIKTELTPPVPEPMPEPIPEPMPDTEPEHVAVPAVAELPMDGLGSLIVVVNSAESRPLKNATVVITDPVTGQTLYTLTTDESGKTPAVNLAAPLRDTTLAPRNGEIVYGLYNITASAEGFLDSNLVNIPVFDSVVSIQQMRLLWLAATGGLTGEQTEDEEEPYTL